MDGALEAFRVVTGWSDEQVLHYASCKDCTPICGYEEYDCDTFPPRTIERDARREVDAEVAG
jgi:hypothetical protein